MKMNARSQDGLDDDKSLYNENLFPKKPTIY